jgi:acetyl esterase/lipase
MTREQRAKIDSMLRSQPTAPPRTIEEQRAWYAAVMSRMIVPDGTRTTEADLADLRTLLVEPEGASRPGTILFFHGGSWMLGSPETELCLTAGLVVRTGFRAYSPDYRLAPEHPFPAGIEDTLTRAGLEHNAAMYMAGQDPRQPLLSPAVAADLTGFPPMLLQVGTNELLLDDSTRLAARATAAGVDVILDITADVPHVFQTYAGILDEADQALDRAALFLRQHIS